MTRRKLCTAALAACLALPALAADDAKPADPKPDAPRADAPRLDGVWEGWVVEGKGDNPNRGQQHLQLTIEGDKITSKSLPGGGGGGGRGGPGGGGDMGSGTFKITDADNVKQMDATRTGGGGGGGGRPGGRRPGGPGGGGGGGASNLGIMTLDGDTLKWCVANRGGRPADFETNRAKGQFLLILTKQKPKDGTPKN